LTNLEYSILSGRTPSGVPVVGGGQHLWGGSAL